MEIEVLVIKAIAKALIFLHTEAGGYKCTKAALFSYTKVAMHMMKAADEATPAIRNRPQKLLSPMLSKETKLLSSGQLDL